MAQIDFNSIHTGESSTQFSNSVDFFSLKNDGDTAIVRFMHDSTDTFELLTVHDITLNDKYRKANCIRQPNEPLENCPLCATGKRVQQRFFIHLIQYVQDSNGNIIGIPKVWERPASYMQILANLFAEYGPLKDNVFKVKRSGARGDMQTSYSIMFSNPTIYNEQLYPKDFSAFENHSPLGTAIIDKNELELQAMAVEMGLEVPPTVGVKAEPEVTAKTTFTPQTEYTPPKMGVERPAYTTQSGMTRTPVKY